MFQRKAIQKILQKAHAIDRDYLRFGARTHRYRLNPPIEPTAAHAIEKTYGFTLPEEYFRFITQVADGGACVSYGINPLANLTNTTAYRKTGTAKKPYQGDLSTPFLPRAMRPEEVLNYTYTEAAYKEAPHTFFVFEALDEEDHEYIHCMDGYLPLGTHGCQWDFGIIVAGDHRGQVFDTDNQGAYRFIAKGFDAFYQDWLDQMCDTAALEKEVAEQKRRIRAAKKQKG